ncbi:hypothetical protein BTHERMOSOX_1038 [Bathymodiolus thermophilus thioautotrophic gill symbiont]|uniref:Uncharacterized protein n=1 Tax=Bathymodiolus thermophilus thioautotrophic gill symbiont TaxID=2360 RepID=A0A8H9CEV7_9GAMM|nr:hypothetical protein THERMOS_311 [Bathymodiolus thermophilus thioautotrophic gill symbiont]SHA29713.1 hypothetical protein BTHERMOSOX_1038 [Bathymodiolus thermophilus thioautotrophic gill symbiont]
MDNRKKSIFFNNQKGYCLELLKKIQLSKICPFIHHLYHLKELTVI